MEQIKSQPKVSHSQPKRIWKSLKYINQYPIDSIILLRARIQTIRSSGSCCFVTLRQSNLTIQGILLKSESISKQSIKNFQKTMNESVIQVQAILKKSEKKITGCSISDLELDIQKYQILNRALLLSPCKSQSSKWKYEYRFLYLRLMHMQNIFKIRNKYQKVIHQFCQNHDFINVATPKLTAQKDIQQFALKYFDKIGYLVNNSSFYHQMCINSDFQRVYQISSNFQTVNMTSTHLCEFSNVNLEICIYQSYSELIALVKKLIMKILEETNNHHLAELQNIYLDYEQIPSKLILNDNIPELSFNQCLNKLHIQNQQYLTNSQIFQLATIIKKQYQTDIFIIHSYPIKYQPFYIMHNQLNPLLSNSFQIIIRGRRFLRGGQKIHSYQQLRSALSEQYIKSHALQNYLKSFEYGSYPHAGCRFSIERLMMVTLGLNNIRESSLFPRDSVRYTP